MAKRPAPLTLRLGEQEEEVLARGDRPGLTIKRDLRRYYDLLDASLPRLTPDEATAALRATGGKAIEPAYLWAELATAGEDALAVRVREMSALEQLALTDALDRAHRLVRQRLTVDDALRQVGLLR